jgi:hypothetical protein
VKDATSFVVGIAFGFLCGASFTLGRQRQEAIDRNLAEWRVIPGTNKTEFKWKDEQ